MERTTEGMYEFRKYYSKTPSQKVIYFYSAVCHQVSPKPIIRPARDPQYYRIKQQLEALANKGSIGTFNLGVMFVMESPSTSIFADLEDERVFYRFNDNWKGTLMPLIGQDIPDTKEGLEKFFIYRRKRN